MTRPIVFVGPSLAVSEAEMILDADYRPPVKQGDLMRVLSDEPSAIGIIDGIFTDVPTVRHREILWVLSQGVPVFGAASMGALRAAELSGHGMVGIGLIYRWYRRFPLVPDDAVAVAHAPAELGSLPVSQSLVDIRRTLRAASRAGTLPAERAQSLCSVAAALPFAARRLEDLPLSQTERTELLGLHVHQKNADARALLRHMASLQQQRAWPRPTTKRPAIVHAWLDDLKSGGFDVNQVL